MVKINGKVVGTESFPNNERVVRTIQDDGDLIFEVFYEHDRDIFVMMTYALLYKDRVKKLYIPYLPYSRADRQVADKLATVEAIVQMINFCSFDDVYILDPHNESVIGDINNMGIWIPVAKWIGVMLTHNIDTICFPDAGAATRYSNLVSPCTTVLTATKNRDPETGRIVSLDLNEQPKPGASVLIIDDLCSKGGTFMLTASKLKEAGAGDIYLFTSHCENSIYESDLIKPGSPIKKFYTMSPLLTGNNILAIIN